MSKGLPMKATETLSKALGFAHFCASQSAFFRIFHFKPLAVTSASKGGLFRSFGASREARQAPNTGQTP